MNFRYVAVQSSGKVVEGNIEAENTAKVLEWMANQGFRPISIKAYAEMEKAGWRSYFSQSITTADKVFLTKYLALMLKMGTNLFSAIDILIADFDKPSVKALLMEIRENLSKGKPFYTTFIKYSKYFSSVFANLIKAAEASGNLERVFEDLSQSLEKEQELRSRIRAALIYPIILLAGAALILTFLVTFALPRIANIFIQGGVEPAGFSRIVFGVGLFLGRYVWVLLPLVLVSIFGAWILFSKTAFGQKLLVRVLYRLPVVRNLLRRIAVQRFASVLSSLLRAGLPMVDSLEITADAVGDEELKHCLLRISREGVSKGITVGDAFRRETYFPKVVTNLIAVSEKAGHMEEVLDTLSKFYASEIDSSIKALVSFLEPILLLGIGLIVAVIAIAIITPIYQLVGAF